MNVNQRLFMMTLHTPRVADLLQAVIGAYGHLQLREFFVRSTTTKMVRTCRSKC